MRSAASQLRDAHDTGRRVSRNAGAFDRDVIKTAMAKLGIDDDELPQPSVLSAPYRAGGIALRQQSTIADIAFFSCAAQALPFINIIIDPLIRSCAGRIGTAACEHAIFMKSDYMLRLSASHARMAADQHGETTSTTSFPPSLYDFWAAYGETHISRLQHIFTKTPRPIY